MKYLENFGQSSLWEEVGRNEFCDEIEKSEFADFDESEKIDLKSTFSQFHDSYFAVTDSDNALFMNSPFSFKKRISILGQALTSKKVINGLIYIYHNCHRLYLVSLLHYHSFSYSPNITIIYEM